MPRSSRMLLLFQGMSDEEIGDRITLADGTVNFYFHNGYLQNYPGREDTYNRTRGDSPAFDGYGAPPPLSTITRITSFIDFTYAEHIVYVYDDKLCVREGGSHIELYQFSGRKIGGASYPDMFLHEGKLIVVNPGDIPLIWDGVQKVNPLGVQEIPAPPLNESVQNYTVLAIADNPYTSEVATVHYDAGQVVPGTAVRKDSGSVGVPWLGKTRVQYYDDYGNHGKASPPSAMFSAGVQPSASPQTDFTSMLTQWEPPKTDTHIRGTRQARTTTFNTDDAVPTGNDTVYWTEFLVSGTTRHRHWQRLTDETLLTQSMMDLDVHGPPIAVFGCSFGGRIWLFDENGIGWYSDLVLFGQFRSTQQVRPYSNTRAVLPAGDRLFMVGESSTEVWFESNNGPALLEQDVQNGSRFGSTFIVYGDGIVFGLWDNGFGFYDGNEHKYIDVPEYIKGYYISADSEDVKIGRKVRDQYMLPIRLDHKTDGNNVIIIYNFSTKAWYVVEETVNDIHEYHGDILGVDDSLYLIFNEGDTAYPESRIVTNGFTATPQVQTTLSEIALLMEQSSAQKTSALLVSSEYIDETADGSILLMPKKNISMDTPIYRPSWDEVNLEYGQSWSTPGDFKAPGMIDAPVPGMYHKLDVTFPAGHQVRLKGFIVEFSADMEVET